MKVKTRIWIVIRRDRHLDDEITVHVTRAGADLAIDAFMKRYSETYPSDCWGPADHSCPSWIRYVESDEDGPSALIEIGELVE